MSEILPNFFVVGAPKAGTTSLYHYLDQHPDIYMSPIKEPCYFASELRPEYFGAEHRAGIRRQAEAVRRYLDGPMLERQLNGPVESWEDYRKLFRNARHHTAVGEASVSYLWSRTAAHNIAEKLPHGKIVMILRDPAERAYSQYRQALAEGRVRRSFRHHIQESLARQDPRFDVLHPLLEFGLYAEQIRRFQEEFPASQIRIYLYEDYLLHPRALLADLFRFLGVDAEFSPDLSAKSRVPRIPHCVTAVYFLRRWGVWRRFKEWSPRQLHDLLRKAVFGAGSGQRLKLRDRRQLQDYYREDVRKLAGLINRNLEAWLR